MSFHLHARAIGTTISAATDTNHKGEPYTNRELPVGSTLAVSRDGDLYIYVMPDTPDGRAEWPNADATGIVGLWRDYWRVLLCAHEAREQDVENKLSPASRAILNASVRAVHHRLATNHIRTVRDFMLLDKIA